MKGALTAFIIPFPTNLAPFQIPTKASFPIIPRPPNKLPRPLNAPPINFPNPDAASVMIFPTDFTLSTSTLPAILIPSPIIPTVVFKASPIAGNAALTADKPVRIKSTGSFTSSTTA